MAPGPEVAKQTPTFQGNCGGGKSHKGRHLFMTYLDILNSIARAIDCADSSCRFRVASRASERHLLFSSALMSLVSLVTGIRDERFDRRRDWAQAPRKSAAAWRFYV